MTTVCKYTTFDNAEGSTHNLVVGLVPPQSRVLEVGCATGYMSEVLKSRLGCHVTAIEVSATAAEIARTRGDRVIVGDIETIDLDATLGKERFDAVVFADVLEHLRDPESVLKRVRPFLTDSGAVVCSVPNIAHGSIRLALLSGDFTYHETGLLDTTHLRFFTRVTLEEMFRRAGYLVRSWRRRQVEIDRTEIIVPASLPQSAREWLAFAPEATTYQFIVQAVPFEAARRISDLAPRESDIRPEPAAEAPGSAPTPRQSEGGEARIRELEGILAERTVWATKSAEDVASRDATIRTLQRQLDERTSWARGLQDDVHERDDRIRGLQKRIDELTGMVRAADVDTAQRDTRIHELQATLDERTAWAAKSAEQIAQSAEMIRDLQRTIGERTVWAQSLESTVAERDERIRSLQAHVDETAAAYHSSARELASRDAVILQLQATLEERTAWATKCDADVKERDQVLRDLERTISEQTTRTQQLQSRVQDLEREARRSATELEDRTDWAVRLSRELDDRDATIGELRIRDRQMEEENRRLSAELAGRLETIALLKSGLEEQSMTSARIGSENAELLRAVEDLTDRLAVAARDHAIREETYEAALERSRIAIEALQEDIARAAERESEQRRAIDGVASAVVDLEARFAEAMAAKDQLASALEQERAARRLAEESIARGYDELRERVRAAVSEAVPAGRTVLVISKGDPALVALPNRTGWHFPQQSTGEYAGFYPPDSHAAIVHLEALRSRGAEFLVVPAPSAWWLSHYSEFRDHLDRSYRRIALRTDACVMYGLREPAIAAVGQWQSDLESAVADFQTRFGREPAILDWNTGLDIAGVLPQRTVFTPPTPGSTLPYADQTIDIVVYRDDDAPRRAEARRVAHASVVVETNGAPRRRTNGSDKGRIHWHARVEVAETALPTTSIVIPCYNGPDVTEACLAALLDTIPEQLGVEIVVVDDASSDGTAEMLRRRAALDNRIRVLRNRENQGFISSCNRGARAARGEIVVFLNNDTLPRPGWLLAMLRTFRDRADAGAVGGKLLYPDGSLQEAGGVIFRDGSGANFGRGDLQPQDPIYSFVREVDYCSGALLATPRSLFVKLGLFDTRYRPAYYEDTDYCFRVREHGLKVYYQPDCEVVHCEGASCGTDLSSGVKRFQAVNRDKFMARWKSVLQTLPPAPDQYDRETWHRLAYRDHSITNVADGGSSAFRRNAFPARAGNHGAAQ